MSRKFDRDLLNNVRSRKVANAAMGVIDALQSRPKEEQIPGMAAAFLLMCDHADIPAQDAFTVAKNIMNATDGIRPEFSAITAYLEGENV